jgi:hypothetical protein
MSTSMLEIAIDHETGDIGQEHAQYDRSNLNPQEHLSCPLEAPRCSRTVSACVADLV